MLLKQVMTRDVEVVSPDSTLQEAAQKMRSLDVGPMPVCDGDRVVGMITDRDITVRAVAEGRDPKSAKVREAMTDDLVYVWEDQEVNEAARLMAERQIRRLLVMSRDRRLAGIVSLGDLAVDSADPLRAGEVLEGVSQPAEPER